MTAYGWPSPVVRERKFVFSGGTTMKKFLIGCGIVTALLVVALVAGVAWVLSRGDVKDIAVVVEGPVAVVAGDEFTLTARIRNGAARPQKLVSLHIADSYLDGIVVRSSEPAFASSEHFALDSSVGHTFDQPIPANGELAVRLHVLALRPGDFAGDFKFCINNSYAMLPHHIRTVVRPATEPAEPPAKEPSAETAPPASEGTPPAPEATPPAAQAGPPK
jgi:hypothetical protein